MDSTTNSEQEQKKQSGSGLSQRLNTISNFGGFKSPFGKAGSGTAKKIAMTAARSPYFWIVLGIIVLFFIVFAIVFSGAPGGIPGAPTQESTQIIVPTETIVPTPAL